MAEHMILVSPTEPDKIRNLGETSIIPETYGADVLIITEHASIGVQRKEVKDLVASLRDGRLAKEISMGKRCHQMIMLIEGSWEWSSQGESMTAQGFHRRSFDGLCLSLQHHRWWIMHSMNLDDSCEMIPRIARWCSKPRHTSLLTKPRSNALWGTSKNRDWGTWLLQSFDGVGVEIAESIYDHFGRVPLTWTCDEQDLMAVPRIGPHKARQLIEALR